MKRRPCRSCPWRKATVPARDIPGYDLELHRKLAQTCQGDGFSLMLCHHAPFEGAAHEHVCAGFVLQVGADSIGLRLAVFSGDLAPDDFEGDDIELHESFEAMLAAGT